MFCIEDFPNEIIYRILDNVEDIYSIISFTCTCQRFFKCRNTYNNYKINFESISKKSFDFICNFMNPFNIIKLKLSDDDNKTPGQIKYFIKNFPVNQLNYLKSLELIQINENDLEDILKYFVNSSLNFLHIEYRQYFGMLNQSTINLLYDILSLKSLKKVYLDMRSYRTDSIQWPNQSSIEYLTLIHLNLNQFIEIIQKPNKFKSIILRNFLMKDSNMNSSSSKEIYLKEIQSFQIEESELFMDKILWLISFMNKLISLKFEGFTSFIDKIFQNNQLENFIQTNLIYLKTFQFFIRFSPVEFKINFLIINSFIEQFQKIFWISKFNCSIICDFIKDSNELYAYSIPSSNHYLKYSDQLSITSISTQPEFNYLNRRFHSIYQLDLNLKDLQIKNCEEEEDIRLFPKLKNLKLTLSDQCLLNSFEILSKRIYLNKLNKIVLIISSRGNNHDLLMKKFLIFLNNLSNINSIEIFNRWYGIFSYINIKYFCSMIPNNIKHLNIDISDINQIKILIENLQHILSFKFKFSFDKSVYINEILEWLNKKSINSTYISDMHYLSVWISQQFNKTNSNKRIKLDH
ncbi:unnamed protein product [Adineta steineri]|uniref:F-box domain-containing protein n=1 Tax=Adineta steineri TaxID=433720 RepID=A0A819AQW3_9BILA|nr:unnamed protein product [Adineta steineri]